MRVPVVIGLSATARTLLALGTLAGGGLAAWRVLQEVVEAKKLGPPAWWVVWRRPLKPSLPTGGILGGRPTVATRVYRWQTDRWVPTTDYLYDSLAKSFLVGGPPEGRSLYAQARWVRDGKLGWKQPTVSYARDSKV